VIRPRIRYSGRGKNRSSLRPLLGAFLYPATYPIASPPMPRAVVTGLGRRLPMPRSFATLKGNQSYDVKISGNAPDRIVIQYVSEPGRD
jgi:hypothetical protein